MKKVKEQLVFFLLLYPFGIILGIIFNFLKFFKVINIFFKERQPKMEKGLMVVSNHPAIPETLILPIILFFEEYLFHPITRSPWSTPDKKNYYDKFWWFPMRTRSIPIERGKSGADAALLKMKRILDDGRILILFPEGGRTDASKSLKTVNYRYSANGKKIREFRSGVGFLAAKTEATILPVWVEGTDKIIPNEVYFKLSSIPKINRKEKINIKIGKPFKCPADIKNDLNKVINLIEGKLLELADEPIPPQ